MKLFFETSGQAQIFLATLPVGFVAAFLFDVASLARASRPFWDVLILLLCGIGLIVYLEILKEQGPRAYHLLALVSGMLLYTSGVGALWRALFRRIAAMKKKKTVQEFEPKVSK